MDIYYIYILFSEKLNKYYVGSTKDLERRISEHNRGKSTFTRTGMPWQLKYFEKFSTKAEAVNRELQIKQRKEKKYIESLVLKHDTEHPST